MTFSTVCSSVVLDSPWGSFSCQNESYMKLHMWWHRRTVTRSCATAYRRSSHLVLSGSGAVPQSSSAPRSGAPLCIERLHVAIPTLYPPCTGSSALQHCSAFISQFQIASSMSKACWLSPWQFAARIHRSYIEVSTDVCGSHCCMSHHFPLGCNNVSCATAKLLSCSYCNAVLMIRPS